MRKKNQNNKNNNKVNGLEILLEQAEIKKSKETLPKIELPDELKLILEEVVELKKKENEVKVERESKELLIIDYVRKVQDDDGFRGNYKKSYVLKGINNELTFVSSDRYFKLNDDVVNELKDLLKDKFSDYVERRFSIFIKDEVLQNPTLQQELIDILGENFSKFFYTISGYYPVKNFDKIKYSLGNLFDKVMSLIKPVKPSLK